MDGLRATEEERNKFKKYAWFTLLGFSFMYAFVYNGRFNMELALPFMGEELNLSKIQVSIITSTLYWSYAFGNFINGRFSEIVGCKRFIMAGILLTVMTNWLVSLCNSFIMITILWGANGFFQSMIWAPGISLIARWWSSGKRGFAAGLAHGFSGLAHIILWVSILITGRVFPKWGWRGFFIIPVSLLFIMSFVYWFMSKEKPSDIGLEDYNEKNEDVLKREESYKKLNVINGKFFGYICLFKQWRFCIWCFISALASISRYGLLTWIPFYYAEKMHININTGIFSTLVLPIGMALGTFVVPWVTDRYFSENRAIAVIICGAMSALMVFIFPSMTTTTTATIAIFWAGFFVYGINGVIWSYAMDVGTRVFAATAAGILDWAAYMGAAVQATFFGYMLHITNNWAYVFATIASLCILIIVLGIIVNQQTNIEIRKTV